MNVCIQFSDMYFRTFYDFRRYEIAFVTLHNCLWLHQVDRRIFKLVARFVNDCCLLVELS